jgi:hypothetical protein
MTRSRGGKPQKEQIFIKSDFFD